MLMPPSALLALVLAHGLARAPLPPAVVQVPVVLDARGLGSSHFTSDLTVVNLGTASSKLELTYIPTPGQTANQSQVLSEQEIDPGVRLYAPDVIAYLRSRGAPLADDGRSKIGTLLVRFPDLTDGSVPFVGSRISTPNTDSSGAVNGSFGTYALGVPAGGSPTIFTAIYGLRETADYRTNLAFVHAGGGSLRPIELRAQLFDGETGAAAGEPLVVTLQPYEWHQIGSVLGLRGLTQGWTRITQSSGDDRFIAYAVVNDGGASGNGTSDGSFLDGSADDGLLPIVLTAGPYRTELVVTNDSQVDSLVNFVYVPANQLGPTSGGSVRVTMPVRTQIIEPDALAFFRRLGLGLPDEGGGVVKVSGAAARARVFSPNPDANVGGTFGLSFGAVPTAKRAKTEAWIYGLRQDEKSRSNVAVANAIVTGDKIYSFEATVFDAAHGYQKAILKVNLPAGQWYQWNAILKAAGVSEGYVRIRCTTTASGGCDFVTYGVVNDGAEPGLGTSDGSYVPMTNVQ